MNETRLGTIEQIRESLASTADVVFTTSNDQGALHQFVATLLKRHGYCLIQHRFRPILRLENTFRGAPRFA